MREVVSHAAATFHQLDLLFVDADDTAVGVGGFFMADHKAVRDRGDLQIVADAGHRSTLRYGVLETVEQFVDFGLAHRVGILLLDAFEFRSDTFVHLLRRAFVDLAEGVLQGILGDPHGGSQVVALEVFAGAGYCLFVGILFKFLHGIWGLNFVVLSAKVTSFSERYSDLQKTYQNLLTIMLINCTAANYHSVMRLTFST